MNNPIIPPDTQKILEALRKVAADTLERKRRLGHYAVVWRNGKPELIGEDDQISQQNHDRAIATVLSDMDKAIASLESRLAKTQAIKQGMMQELLTGKTRLI